MITSIDAPVDANVWKVLLDEQSEIKPNQVIAILEAMKLEINVHAPEDLKGGKLAKVLVRPGDTVKAGGHIALVTNDP